MWKLAWPRVAAWRVRRQYLDQRAPAGDLLAVVTRLCGLHAQVMSSAELTAWARVENLDRQAIQRALWDERTLVKTWAMRGTLHLLRAGEMPLWHAALGTSPRYLKPALWQKYFGITQDQLEQLTEAVATALDGRVMTREELVGEVARLTGSATFAAKLGESSWGTVLKPAAFTGRLCFGPSLGQRVRFTRPDTWLAAAEAAGTNMGAEMATAEVTRRFLTAYGPATCHDLARWWGGGGVSAARLWIASLGEEVSRVEIDGAEAWMLTADARAVRDMPSIRSVRLLPAFDQYVVSASCHAEHLLAGGLRQRIYRPQGWISPVLLVNGKIQGIWRHEIKGSGVLVAIEPFVSVPAWVRRAAGQEAERLAAFFGRALTLRWTN